jgi:PAS domain S-box-containing protein
MHTVTTIQAGQQLKRYIQENLPDIDFINIDKSEKLPGFLDELETNQSTADLIIVGSAVKEPIRTAQKIHFIDKSLSVILLATKSSISSLSRALQTSPLLGDEVSALAETNNKFLLSKIKEAATNTRKRRLYSRSIFRANQDISTDNYRSSEVGRYLDRLLEEAPVGICMVNARLNILAVNKYAAALLGIHEREALGQPLLSLLINEQTRELKDYFKVASQDKNSRSKIFIHGNEKKYLELTVSRLKKEAPEAGILVLIQDVTDRMQAVEKEKERARLVALNNSKEEFISLASHQLRTPATAVKQYVGMLLEGYFGDMSEEQHQMLKIAYESNERQINIINDLLRVARIDAGKVTLNKTTMSLTDMVLSIVQDELQRFEKLNQKLTCDLGNKEITATLDPTYIRMAIENIIDNAHKYTPAGKRVAIRMRQTNNHVILQVEDKGVGIKPDDQKKLFRKFSRIDNPLSVSVGGTGLGLYWAKKVIEHHDGKISLRSKPGAGTVFTITLPISSINGT